MWRGARSTASCLTRVCTVSISKQEPRCSLQYPVISIRSSNCCDIAGPSLLSGITMPKRGRGNTDFNGDDYEDQLPPSKRTEVSQALSEDANNVGRAIDFSSNSGSVWYILNKKYNSSKGSVEYERSFGAVSEVKNCIKTIHCKATVPGTVFETKKSAL